MIITSKYYKPAFPLQLDDDYIYPKTTADQVIADETSNLQEIIDQLRRSVIIQYTHSSSGLTSSTPTTVENGKFKAYDTMDISSIDINGTTYNVNSGTIKITKDSWYMFLLDFTNQTIHFLSSSGVSSEDLSAFYITYNANGGTLPLSAVTNFGQATPSFMLPEPTKTGYTFEGWYAYEDFSGDEVTQVMQGTATNLTFYAKWQVNSYTYNIVYKSSSGVQLGTATATYNYDTTNSISPKAFTGYTSPSAQSVKWDSVNAKTITFTYTPITYTITYNLKGGTNPSSAKTTYTIEDVVTLPTPTRYSGDSFLGWFTSSALSGTKVTSIPKGTTGNKTYYSSWINYVLQNGAHKSFFASGYGGGGQSISDGIWNVSLSTSSTKNNYSNATANLTNFTTLHFTITKISTSENFWANVGFTQTAQSYPTHYKSFSDESGTDKIGTYTLDISSLTGEWYFAIRGKRGKYDGTAFNFSEIWLT